MFEQSANLNIIFGSAPIVVGVLLAVGVSGTTRNHGYYGWAALLFYAVGFSAFAAAKTIQFKKGIAFSFGTRGMVTWQRCAYRAGYILMAAGLLMTIALFIGAGSIPP